jgi:hypothetical protein
MTTVLQPTSFNLGSLSKILIFLAIGLIPQSET